MKTIKEPKKKINRPLNAFPRQKHQLFHDIDTLCCFHKQQIRYPFLQYIVFETESMRRTSGRVFFLFMVSLSNYVS